MLPTMKAIGWRFIDDFVARPGHAGPDPAGHSSMDSISVAATAKSTAQLANDEAAPPASLPLVIVELL